MKLIKEGKWHLVWSVEKDCKTCEAKLLIEEEDVKPVHYTDSGYSWTCLVCGKSNAIGMNDIAERVREAVDKHRTRPSRGSAWD